LVGDWYVGVIEKIAFGVYALKQILGKSADGVGAVECGVYACNRD
jgi:hypothetical protein